MQPSLVDPQGGHADLEHRLHQASAELQRRSLECEDLVTLRQEESAENV
eukprot:gene5148-5231_t